MLQIVIWMLCIYLVVKGFEILAPTSGRTRLGIAGALIAWTSAPLFFLLSVAQSAQSESNPNSSESISSAPAATSNDDPSQEQYRKCLREAADLKAAAACDQLHAEGKL